MDEETCEACGGTLLLLGQLGRRACYRCRDCGLDHSRRLETGESVTDSNTGGVDG